MFGRWSINQHQCKYWGFFSLAKLMFHTAYGQATSHETSIGTGVGFVAVRVFALQTRLIHNRSSIRSTDVLESWQARCGMTRSHKPVKECEGWYAHASLYEHGGWLISVEYSRYPMFCRDRAISWTNLCAGVLLQMDIRTYGQKKNKRPDAPWCGRGFCQKVRHLLCGWTKHRIVRERVQLVFDIWAFFIALFGRSSVRIHYRFVLIWKIKRLQARTSSEETWFFWHIMAITRTLWHFTPSPQNTVGDSWSWTFSTTCSGCEVEPRFIHGPGSTLGSMVGWWFHCMILLRQISIFVRISFIFALFGHVRAGHHWLKPFAWFRNIEDQF